MKKQILIFKKVCNINSEKYAAFIPAAVLHHN